MSSILEITDVHRSLGGESILKDISFTMEKGTCCAVLGESGSGKTTLLRAIAGFESIDKGRIELGGKVLSDQNTFIQPEQRNVGIVFQDYALFPHLSVKDNIAFACKDRSQAKALTTHYLNVLGIASLADRFPHQISGGQQQRVAIARSLAAKPELLLLDEPFSNLDQSLKWTVRHELKSILTQEGISSVLVTHDVEDALEMAEKLVVLHHGEVAQTGTPKELYDHPTSVYIAGLFGAVNLIDPELAQHLCKNISQQVKTFVIRPEHIQIRPEAGDVLVEHTHFKGSHYEIHLQWHERMLVAYSSTPYTEGTRLSVSCTTEHLVAIP